MDVGALFRLHGPMVYRRALRLLGRREDAEEATQEVFVRVMRSSSQFDGRSSMSTWLYQITTNYCLNQLRDRGRRRQLFEQNMQEDDHKSSAAVDGSYGHQRICTGHHCHASSLIERCLLK